MWDERYRGTEYAYGVEVNDFLRAQAEHIQPGPVLCLAEGEGRNAVFLALRGHPVSAVDFSAEGLRKAQRLAREHEVQLELIEADLASFDLGTERWSGIVSIFAHTPPEIRRRVHAAILPALRPGGVLVLEAYRPERPPERQTTTSGAAGSQVRAAPASVARGTNTAPGMWPSGSLNSAG